MSSVTESNLEKKFQHVSNTQDSIQTFSLWIIHHKSHCKKIIDVWMKIMRKTKVSHRLTLLYLANDVIQNARRKGATQFSETFSTVLPEATVLLRDDKIKGNVERVFNIWESRNIYTTEAVDELKSILNNSELNNDATAKIIAEFKPEVLTEKIRKTMKVELETTSKLSALNGSKLDAANSEVLRQFKDRSHGQQFSRDFEEATRCLEEYIGALEREAKERTEAIQLLEQAVIYYDTQKGEARIVANAYKSFSTRVSAQKKRLEGLVALLPSPFPSPCEDAPSPMNSDEDMDIATNTSEPTEKSFLQAEETFLHAEKSFLPTEKSYSPAGKSFLQAEETFLQAEKSFLPAEKSFLPAEKSFLSAEKSFFPTEKSFLPTEKSFLPSEKSFLTDEKSPLPTEKTYLPTECSYSPTESSFLPAENSFLPSENSFLKGENSFLQDNSFLKADTFLKNDKSFLNTETSFLKNDKTFLKADNSFMQSEKPFLKADDSFMPSNKSFLKADDSFMPSEKSFLKADDSFMPSEKSFLKADNSFMPSEKSFLKADNTFMPSENSFLQSTNSFLPAVGAFSPAENCFSPVESSFSSVDNSFLPEENSFLPEENSFLQADNSFLPVAAPFSVEDAPSPVGSPEDLQLSPERDSRHSTNNVHLSPENIKLTPPVSSINNSNPVSSFLGAQGAGLMSSWLNAFSNPLPNSTDHPKSSLDSKVDDSLDSRLLNLMQSIPSSVPSALLAGVGGETPVKDEWASGQGTPVQDEEELPSQPDSDLLKHLSQFSSSSPSRTQWPSALPVNTMALEKPTTPPSEDNVQPLQPPPKPSFACLGMLSSPGELSPSVEQKTKSDPRLSSQNYASTCSPSVSTTTTTTTTLASTSTARDDIEPMDMDIGESDDDEEKTSRAVLKKDSQQDDLAKKEDLNSHLQEESGHEQNTGIDSEPDQEKVDEVQENHKDSEPKTSNYNTYQRFEYNRIPQNSKNHETWQPEELESSRIETVQSVRHDGWRSPSWEEAPQTQYSYRQHQNQQQHFRPQNQHFDERRPPYEGSFNDFGYGRGYPPAANVGPKRFPTPFAGRGGRGYFMPRY